MVILYLFIFCSDMESVESADEYLKKILASDLSDFYTGCVCYIGYVYGVW